MQQQPIRNDQRVRQEPIRSFETEYQIKNTDGRRDEASEFKSSSPDGPRRGGASLRDRARPQEFAAQGSNCHIFKQ
jgi:hypothetical protein